MAGRSRVGSGQRVSGADSQVTGPRLAEGPSPAATEASRGEARPQRRSWAQRAHSSRRQGAGSRVEQKALRTGPWREQGRGWGSTRTTGASEVLGKRAAPVCACVCVCPYFPREHEAPVFMGVGTYLPLLVRIP